MMQGSIAQPWNSTWGSQNDCPTLLKAVRPNSGHEPIARKRNPLACEWCYKKKVKCEIEGSNTACVQCVRRNIRCKFTTRKEKREAVKRTQYVEVLEERLRRTESLLRAAGVFDEAAINQEELDNDEEKRLDSGSEPESRDEESISPNLSRNRDGRLRRRSDRNVNGSAKSASLNLTTSPGCCRPGNSPDNSELQHLPVFKSDHREESRYYGRASSLSILSRDGIEWIKAKTGDTQFLNFIYSNSSSHDCPWDYWRADVFHDLFSSQVYKPLPPRAEVFSIMEDYFQTTNRLIPLYDEPSFMRLVEWQYTQQTCNDAAWWASVNIILALGYEYRTSDNSKPERNREKAWLYFKNAMSVFPELALRRTDLLSLQALLGLAFFLRGNSGARAAMPIITAAMRSCHRLGLHRDIPRPHLPHNDLEQRRRVFWIAYILDQSSCVRVGSAPAQSIDDFDVSLPEVDQNSLFFRQMCSLNVIKSRIYSRLYSARGLQKTPEEVCQVVKELHTELEEWIKANPIANSHHNEIKGDDFIADFASVGLQLIYYNCLIMVHRMPPLLHYYAHRLENGSQINLDPKLFGDQVNISASIYVRAARETLKLVNSMPWGAMAWIWPLLYYVFLAVMSLFVSILRDSQHPKAREDLQLLSMAATFFATLIPGDWPCYYAKFMSRMCSNFERIARTVIEKEEKSKSIKNRTNDKPSRSLSKAQGTRFVQQATQTSPQRISPASRGIEIANAEGLAPVNSSSYVVPGNSSTSANSSAAPNNYPTNTFRTALYPDLGPYTTATTVTNSNLPLSCPLDTTTYSTAANDMNSIAWSDFWQIPLAADWEFNDLQFVNGLFSHSFNYEPTGGEQSFLQTAPMSTAAGVAPAAMVPPLGYFFGVADPNLPQGQGQGQRQSMSIWPDGFLDSMI